MNIKHSELTLSSPGVGISLQLELGWLRGLRTSCTSPWSARRDLQGKGRHCPVWEWGLGEWEWEGRGLSCGKWWQCLCAVTAGDTWCSRDTSAAPWVMELLLPSPPAPFGFHTFYPSCICPFIHSFCTFILPYILSSHPFLPYTCPFTHLSFHVCPPSCQTWIFFPIFIALFPNLMFPSGWDVPVGSFPIFQAHSQQLPHPLKSPFCLEKKKNPIKQKTTQRPYNKVTFLLFIQ